LGGRSRSERRTSVQLRGHWRHWRRQATLDVDLESIGRPVQTLIAVRIRPPSRRNIEAFVIDRLTERTEVADVRTSVVYEHLRTQVIPPVAARRR
jgi:hypothetical protein